jgi:hypothetical protein
MPTNRKKLFFSEYVIYPNFKNISKSWGIKNILIQKILSCPLECLSISQNLGYQCNYALNNTEILCTSCADSSNDFV